MWIVDLYEEEEEEEEETLCVLTHWRLYDGFYHVLDAVSQALARDT